MQSAKAAKGGGGSLTETRDMRAKLRATAAPTDDESVGTIMPEVRRVLKAATAGAYDLSPAVGLDAWYADPATLESHLTDIETAFYSHGKR